MPVFQVLHSGPNGEGTVDRGRFEQIELERCRTVRKVEWLPYLAALPPVRGRCCGPNGMANDRGCYHAALKPAGMPDMKWTWLPSADNFVVLPMTFDLQPMIVESAASVAVPIDQILKWA